jgi:hypothetical protein
MPDDVGAQPRQQVLPARQRCIVVAGLRVPRRFLQLDIQDPLPGKYGAPALLAFPIRSFN